MINTKIEKSWGQIRQTTNSKKKRIETLKKQLTNQVLASADLSRGRALYTKTCAKCHRLLGEGGQIGPDITDSNRASLDYILHNIVDPYALIGRNYRMTQIITVDGRVVTGLVKDETDTAVTSQTATERLVIDKEDIDERQLSKTSMMPEGQLDNMKPDQTRDLIGYLTSPTQVPLPRAEAKQKP